MRYIVGVISVVLVTLLSIFLIVTRDGSDTPEAPRTVDLSEYADRDARVQFTVYGRTVAQEDRRAIRISVSRTERYIEVLHGYNESVARREIYSNLEPAYFEFIMALERAGFASELGGVDEDERGYCPLGNRLEYELYDNQDHVFRNWSTTCSGREGSFDGNASLVRQLFQLQIPNYREVTRGVRL